jgi:hypothetical protein
MNLRAGRTKDDLVLIDQRRHRVALVEHVIDALARYRASDMAHHHSKQPQTVALSQSTLAIEKKTFEADQRTSADAAYRVQWIASGRPTPAVPERVAPASARQSGPVYALVH